MSLSKIFLSALAASLIGVAVGAATIHGTVDAQAQSLTGLTIGRYSASSVDAIRWDGSTWITLVPSSAIPPELNGGITFYPRIISVMPNTGFSNIGLFVQFCNQQIQEQDPCYSKGFLYTPSSGTTSALTVNSSPVAPVAWMPSGMLLVEDYLNGQGYLYDPVSGTPALLPIPELSYSLPLTPQGLSYTGSRLLYSSDIGERIANLSDGSAITLPGIPSAYNTGWLSFDPSGSMAAIVQMGEDQANRVGGGTLKIYGSNGTGPLFSPTSTNAHLDFDPAWANGGQDIIFFRADGASWAVNPQAFGADGENLPAAIMSYNLGSGITTTIVPDGTVRRNMIVPGGANSLAYLEQTTGTFKAYSIDIPGGQPSLLVTDGMEHTALGWAQ